MKETTAKIIAAAALYFTFAMAYLAVALALWWLMWMLWTWVMPQVWATGPAGFVSPGYWAFAAMWTLFVVLARVLRGSRK